MRKPMNFLQWVVATAIAAVTMATGFATYVHNWLYTRAEANALAENIVQLEKRAEKHESEDREDIRRIQDKLDAILERLPRRGR